MEEEEKGRWWGEGESLRLRRGDEGGGGETLDGQHSQTFSLSDPCRKSLLTLALVDCSERTHVFSIHECLKGCF